MKKRRPSLLFIFSVISAMLPIAICAQSKSARAQSQNANAGSLDGDLQQLVETPAIPGYESGVANLIRAKLKMFPAKLDVKTDNLDDIIVTVGSGRPKKLIVAPMDEPGYVASDITEDGYIRLQRLPQFAFLPLFNELYSAQPVEIQTRSGKWINGVVAGLSVHLQPGRTNAPNPEDIENMYVDIGASSAAEVKRLGADLLSPVVIDRTLYFLGSNFATADAIGDRFGDAALLDVLRHLDPSKVQGTLVVAFVAQQWAGARGLERVLDEIQPDELVYVGRLLPSPPNPPEPKLHRGPRREMDSGVLVGAQTLDNEFSGFAGNWKQLANSNNIPIAEDYSAPLLPRSYLAAPKLPDKTVHLGIATAWPDTSAEMISRKDLDHLTELLEVYAQGRIDPDNMGFVRALDKFDPINGHPTNEQIISHLVETYGVSDHEAAVREEVKALLPKWAKPETDDAGNLVLHVGTAPAGSHSPRILFVAHMDEIGYEVEQILPDGRLAVETKGGGYLDYYLGHPALVHTSDGKNVPGVMELPQGWDEPGFQWPRGRALMYHVDIGARSANEVAQMGVKTGDFVTIPKKYRRLAGSRANSRSFDDRVGDAALISAVWALGPNFKGRDVTFAWSTGEELGLVGAGKLAARLAKEGRPPDYVFAIDTFVSSDSPLESKRFAGAKVGSGFVVRAVDNSNIVPRKLVEKVLSIAAANQIPAQYGVTGGGNDGSAYLRYGSIDVALGWPLRYSHSPGEVIDVRDLDSLSRIVAAISRSW